MKYLAEVRTKHFALARKLVKSGFRVIWVSDPPCQKTENLRLLSFVEHFLAKQFEVIGCSAFCAGEWIESIGGFKPEFRSTDIDPITGEPDITHGSIEYYRQLMKEIFTRFPIKPQYLNYGAKAIAM